MGARRLAALAGAGLLLACSAPREQPDLILISVDTLRADRLGAYGHPGARTPVFDALAERGRLFSEATTPFPRTTPALASLFTGLEPARHGSREVGEPRRAGTTLAEVLAAHGWATVGVTANGVAGARENLHSGFGRFLEKEDLPSERAENVTDAALAQLEAVPEEQPLFLWAHYVDPHYTYNPPADFDPGAEGRACRALMTRVKRREIRKGRMQSDEAGVAEAARASCSALYDAEVAYADSEIGRLLEGLRRAGRLEHAYLVFTSDHGENLGEAGLYFEHGPSVHDASLRVPLVVAGPDVAPGRDARPIVLQDLAPTLLSLAGVPPGAHPPGDGTDQAARVRSAPRPQAPAEGVAFAESGSALRIDYTGRPWSGTADGLQCFHDARWSYCGAPGGAWTLHDREAGAEQDLGAQHPDVVARFEAARAAWQPGELRERSARSTRFKLVAHPQLGGGWRRALYDLETDPGETRDVQAAHPEVAARLGAALDAWLAATPAAELMPSEADVEALRNLGYVD
jgi:arylsulfatase A-like enzyme